MYFDDTGYVYISVIVVLSLAIFSKCLPKTGPDRVRILKIAISLERFKIFAYFFFCFSNCAKI